jgi:site-specific DNA recombinase
MENEKIAVAPFTGTMAPPQTYVAPEAVQVTYCLYARKSTEQDEKQALSIDSQIKEMIQVAQRDGLNVVEMRKESHSAKASGQRPVFNTLIEDLRSGKFNAILTWAPDRLSRNAGDLGSLVDLMDQKLLVEIKTYSQKFSNNPNEKFLLMILCSQAKLENDNKSINVKRGLRTRVEMGLWPGCAPTGYLNEKRSDRKCQVIPDPIRSPIVRQIFEKFGQDGWSGRKVHRWLEREMKFTTKNGKRFMPSNIYLMLRNPFYYGVYEYPRGSGSWYTGKHTPIISKELFEAVQAKLDQGPGTRNLGKEFAFTRLIRCAWCKTSITADEKFKIQKNGNTHRYVYYGCIRKTHQDCKGGLLREEELISQLVKIVDEISLDQLGIKEKIEQELRRYDKFRYGVLGLEKETNKQSEIDSKNYAKYILKEGAIAEKRELLSCMTSKLIYDNKTIRLEK